MDELEQEYKGKVDVIRFDLTVLENQCEFSKYGITHIPGMLYIAKDGRIIEKTDSVVEKEPLKLKLENLLKQ